MDQLPTGKVASGFGEFKHTLHTISVLEWESKGTELIVKSFSLK